MVQNNDSAGWMALREETLLILHRRWSNISYQDRSRDYRQFLIS